MSRPQNKENLMSLADQMVWGMSTYGSMFNYETQTGALAEPVTASKGNGHVVAVYNSDQDVLVWWVRGNADTVWFRKGEETEASYVIWSDGLTPPTYYAKNGSSGAIDFSGIDASTVIQAAIDYVYAGARDGGRVYLQEGLYTISSTITIYGNLIIEGAGQQSTKLILANNADCNIFEYTGASNNLWFHMYHMLLDGNKDNNVAGTGIYINSVGQFQDIIIMHVFVARFSGDGFYTNQGWGLRLIDFLAEYNEGHGINIFGGSRAQILSCKLRENAQQGINVRGGGAIIMGNDVGMNGWGGLAFGGGADEGIVTGNTICDNTGSGLTLGDGCNDYVITSNMFDGGGTSIRGINVQATAYRTLIATNKFMDHTGAAILDTGSGTKINNNLGYVTENNGIATILDTTTSIVITHGLSYTPTSGNTAWTVTYLENPTNDPGSWYIDTFTATQATIHVFRDPGVSNLDIAWSARRTP